MKSYQLKITTISYLNENQYKEYKNIRNVNWKELEDAGIFVLRTDDKAKEVRAIYELSVTDLHDNMEEDDFCACGGFKMHESNFCKDCI